MNTLSILSILSILLLIVLLSLLGNILVGNADDRNKIISSIIITILFVLIVVFANTLSDTTIIEGIELGVKGQYDIEYTILNGDTTKVVYKLK